MITIAGFRFTQREWRAMKPEERAALLEALRPAMPIARRWAASAQRERAREAA